MGTRFAIVAVAMLVVANIVTAQPSNLATRAAPPDRLVLERLNLKSEWSVFLPVEGNRDALVQVQVLDDQVFVQTRAGMLVAIDAQTGRTQWAARLGTGSYGNAYPVAANSQFVFCAHVTKLYAFYRYTGVTEFVAELNTPPTTGLAADETSVYCVLGMRTGNAGAHRVAVYDLPRAINVNEPIKGPIDPFSAGAKTTATNPIDDLTKRYAPGRGASPTNDTFDLPNRPKVMQVPIGGVTGSRSPSLSTLPSVVPPYSLDNRAPSPSLNTLPSLRQPYHVRLESQKYIQQTPSLGVIPPSVAASLILADLRPKAVEPPLRWEYGLTSRILYPLTQTPTRVWAITAGDEVLALNKNSQAGKVVTEVSERLTTSITAAPSQSGSMNYVPLNNGSVIAVDAIGGNLSGGLNIIWRANAGGLNNHQPYITEGHVYAAGDNTGVVCLERKTGDLVWRSDNSADRIIGANREFVYIRDRQGRFLVYDAKRATDPTRKKSAALRSADFSEFNVHIVNTASDRVFLGSDNGLLVCLRDVNPKYAKPVQITPPPIVNPPKKILVEGSGGTPVDPKTPDPKKDPDPKKEPEKKP